MNARLFFSIFILASVGQIRAVNPAGADLAHAAFIQIGPVQVSLNDHVFGPDAPLAEVMAHKWHEGDKYHVAIVKSRDDYEPRLVEASSLVDRFNHREWASPFAIAREPIKELKVFMLARPDGVARDAQFTLQELVGARVESNDLATQALSRLLPITRVERVIDIEPFYNSARRILNLSGKGVESIAPGVLHDFVQQHPEVVGLNLSYNPVQNLPADVGELEQLQVIGLEHTALAEFPPQLRQLRRLREVLVARAPFTREPGWNDLQRELEQGGLHVRV